jgi:hypothetical protein
MIIKNKAEALRLKEAILYRHAKSEETKALSMRRIYEKLYALEERVKRLEE